METLSDIEKEEVFSVITEAINLLGLGKSESEKVFVVLNQMIIKGKITTQELRRQLGELLPGSFSIMAKALGVTTAKLDNMLRRGELFTSDALPKFAKEIKINYNLPFHPKQVF